MNFIERSRALVQMGKGILSRLYDNIKKSEVSNEKTESWRSKEIFPIVKKIEKSFPEQPDYSKIQHGDQFTYQAEDISKSLTSFHQLMEDVLEFNAVSLDVLKNIPKDLIELKFERNQVTLMLYLDLLICYIRVLLVFSMYSDRKMLYALYHATSVLSAKGPSKTFDSAVELLNISQDISRFFIDTFGPLLKWFKILITQMIPILTFYENTEYLMTSSFLNMMDDDIDSIGYMASYKLPCSPSLTGYTEVLYLRQYTEYIIYLFYICPPLLYQEDLLNIFKQVTNTVFAVELFREWLFHIPEEFEKLTTVFPSKQDKVLYEKPHGYKLKNKLKEIFKTNYMEITTKSRKRRAYIVHEITQLYNILLLNPGLLGPRFPQILAACTYAKNECIHYFQHYNNVTQTGKLPKEYKKYFENTDEYICPMIQLLLKKLDELSQFIRVYRCIVTLYYCHYIQQNDHIHLENISQKLYHKFSVLQPWIKAFVSELRNVDLEKLEEWMTSALTSVSYLSWSVADTYTEAEERIYEKVYDEYKEQRLDYQSYRLNIERCIYTMSTTNLTCYESEIANTSEKFVTKLMSLLQRTRYIDSIEKLIVQYILPYECTWYMQANLLYEYSETLTTYNLSALHITNNNMSTQNGTSMNNSVSSLTPTHRMKSYSYIHHIFLYLDLIPHMIYSVHTDYVDEYSTIINSTLLITKAVITVLSTYLTTQLDTLYKIYHTFQHVLSPIRVAEKFQKTLELKKKRKSMSQISVLFPIPGHESDLLTPPPTQPWPTQTVHDMQLLQEIHMKLSTFISLVNDHRFIIVHHHQYDLFTVLKRAMTSWYEQKVRGIFFTSPLIHNSIRRASHVQSDMSILSQTIQSIFSLSPLLAEWNIIMRSVLNTEITSTITNFPTVGKFIPWDIYTHNPYLVTKPESLSPRVNSIPLIWRITSWIETIIDTIYQPKSNHIFIPHLMSIIPLSTTVKSTYTVPKEIEKLMNNEDLRRLCMMIGCHGVKCIDSYLMKLITDKLTSITSTLLEMKPTLITILQDNMNVTPKTITSLKGLSDIHNVSVYIGLCLGVRQMIHQALHESMNIITPNMLPMISTIKNFVSTQSTTLPAVASINILKTDLGQVMSHDVNLIETLKPYFSTKMMKSEENPWIMFPIASVLTLLCDKWDNAVYLSEYHSFKENEHCSIYALASLLPCLSGISQFIHDKILNIEIPIIIKDTNYYLLSIYTIKLMSTLLLNIRLLENTSGYTSKSYRKLSILLHKFVQYSQPNISYDIIQAYFPLIYNSHIDICMDKYTSIDILSTSFQYKIKVKPDSTLQLNLLTSVEEDTRESQQVRNSENILSARRTSLKMSNKPDLSLDIPT